MKHIGLLFTYSAKNAGDMAITLGAIDLISNTNNRISIVSIYSGNDPLFIESSKYLAKRYPDLEQIPSPYALNRDAPKLQMLKQHTYGFLKVTGIIKDRKFKNKIKCLDKIYFNGGNIIRCKSITDFIRLIALTYPLRIALKSGIPITILPQSTTKINWIGRALLKPVINASNQVYCREKLSFNMLSKYFPNAKVLLNTDLAFYINHSITKQKLHPPRIALTLRAYSIGDLNELSEDKQNTIEIQIKKLTNKLTEKGYEVYFVVQTKKDLEFTQRIYNYFRHNKNVSFFECYEVLSLIKFYSECTLLIGMRLHSIILALTTGTTCIGYFEKSWGLKNPGIIQTFNQNLLYLDEEEKSLYDFVKILTPEMLIQNEKKIKGKIKQFKSEFIIV